MSYSYLLIPPILLSASPSTLSSPYTTTFPCTPSPKAPFLTTPIPLLNDPRSSLYLMDLDLQSLFGLHWQRPRWTPPPPPIWVHIWGRYWSAQIDDIFLYLLLYSLSLTVPKGGICICFLFYVRCSTLLHLPPLRFHCVGGCWEWTQDCCVVGIDSHTL